MPIIAYYSNRNEAQEAFNILELNGVPPYIKDAGTWSDPCRTALVVLIPEQVDDAIELLKNPDHQVQNPVDMEQFYEIENSGDSLKSISRYVAYGSVAAFAFVFAVFYFLI